MPRALLSVYDKTDIVKFASALTDLGWDLVASGKTEQMLRDAGLEVASVESITGHPEILGGRVKTLHPAVHAGILARNLSEDLVDLEVHGYAPIKMVVCNLYPFRETVSKSGVTLQDAVENIDIGGVTLLRAAAKNFLHVASVSDVSDYAKIIIALKSSGEIDLALRRTLAVKAFAHTRDYDTAIHAYLSQGAAMPISDTPEVLPSQLSIGMQKVSELRYGENSHQPAAYYSQRISDGPLGGSILSEGKQLSYNNILDLNAAWRAVSSFEEPTVVIVKHLTPIGIASASHISEAYQSALLADPVSAFGGVIAVNREVDNMFIDSLGSLFVEAIAAPSFSPEALKTLTEKRKNCRLLQVPHPYDGIEFDIHSVHRGILVQSVDMGDPSGSTLKTVTQRAPTPQELLALQYAWKAVGHVKSNAIVLAIPGAIVGVGGGLPSRVDAVKLAISKAGERSKDAVMASDAFFPFADGVEAAIQAGVTAIIQPGGSIRDAEVIEAANRANVAMIFTGVRHFRH